jgi:hypothetical protein
MRIYPEDPYKGITYAEEKNSFMRQGVEPKKAQEVGLALSTEWKTFVNGKEIITYSAPVTHAGPQSFAMITFDGEPLLIEVEYGGPLRGAELLPRELNIPIRLKGNRIRFFADKACNLVIEANHSFRSPLALFLSPEDEIPDPEDPKVLWFTPGIQGRLP